MGELTQRAAFTLPVIQNRIYVGQRATPPYQGYYGAIGGKAQTHIGEDHLHTARTEWRKVVTAANLLASYLGEEFPSEAAIRELCEEMFSGRAYPDGFEPRDITDVMWLGLIRDRISEGVRNDCYFFLARVNRRDFSPSPREILDIKPLIEVPWERVYPLTQLALAQIAERVVGVEPYEHLKMPFVGPLPSRETDMAGPHLRAQREGTRMESLLE